MAYKVTVHIVGDPDGDWEIEMKTKPELLIDNDGWLHFTESEGSEYHIRASVIEGIEVERIKE